MASKPRRREQEVQEQLTPRGDQVGTQWELSGAYHPALEESANSRLFLPRQSPFFPQSESEP